MIVNPNAEPVVSYGLTSRVMSQAALNSFVTTRIVPAFAGTPGLGRTSVVGGPPSEYRVELIPAALAAVKLSAGDVAGAIGEAGNVQSVGTADRYHQHYVLLVDAAIHDARTLAAVGIALKAAGTAPLASLGRVRLGVGVAAVQAAVNGEHGVIFNAFPLAGADAVAFTNALEARLSMVRGALPADVTVVKYWDQTRLIVDSQGSLRDAILLGALLAIVAIDFFLRSVRMTLVAAAIIPLALAIATLALERSGQSLNLMSVGGLAVAVGLIIDDTIVVIEAIAWGIADNPNLARERAIGDAVGKIARPTAASAFTTVVVFIPLGLLSGVAGFFFARSRSRSSRRSSSPSCSRSASRRSSRTRCCAARTARRKGRSPGRPVRTDTSLCAAACGDRLRGLRGRARDDRRAARAIAERLSTEARRRRIRNQVHATVAQADSDVRTAQAQVTVTGAQAAAAQTRYEVAQRSLAVGTLRAPVEGVVTAIPQAPGGSRGPDAAGDRRWAAFE